MMAKRARATENEDPRTPKRAKSAIADTIVVKTSNVTPGRPKSILKDTTTPSVNRTDDNVEGTPGTGRVLFKDKAKSTPRGSRSTPKRTRTARNDASARKKSAAMLHKQEAVVADAESDVDEDNIHIARRILGVHDEDEAGATDDEPQVDDADPTTNDETVATEAITPVKRGRGRPKGSKRARTPTPPPDMPAHEWYFFRNRTTADKTSSNALPSHLLLNHDDYLAETNAYQDPHKDDIYRLKQLHARSFEQWQFELEEGFSLCLYGYGSKRDLLQRFAGHLYNNIDPADKVIVVNGYNPTLGIKDVLALIAAQVIPASTKIPNQVNILLEAVMRALDQHRAKVYLIIHNLDAVPLRKPQIQAMIARLVSHQNVALMATCDNLNFGLLWDINLLRQYNFAFHDATTFEPWSIELDSVEEVNLLLGRSSRRLTGKDGVGYVLRSLPENARNLFKLLVTEQLMLDVEYNPDAATGGGAERDDDVLGGSDGDDEELAALQQTPSKKGRGRPKKAKSKAPKSGDVEGVDYRALYSKAVQDFVCSSEVSFRTLLKEFHDHQMLESRKDLMGTERLIVPFRREELESILEEL